MNCDDIQASLADYLGDELSSGDSAAFETHLLSCHSCRDDVSALRTTLDALNQLEAAPEVPTVAAVFGSRRLRGLGYAAVLLLGVGLGWWLKPTDAREHVQRGVVDSTALVAGERYGVHPSWITASGASANDPSVSRFARNVLEFSRALSRSTRR